MQIKKYIPSFIKEAYTNIKYIQFIKKNKVQVLSDSDTIDSIVKDKKSIARFGDGEFKWMLGIKQQSFQNESELLSKKLQEVINCKDNNILICVPEAFKTINKYTKNSKMFWKNFIRWHGKSVLKYIDKEYRYGNTNFTRWYIEYKDKTNMKEKLENLKKIWNDRELLIIEGEDTKLGVGNDLFKNSKSIERIIAPSKNAFDKYDEILLEAKKIDKNKLILIALGPTATVLAYDLAKEGYQALDVGHIDIEYEWYLRKSDRKVLIPGKYVNEAGGIKEEIFDHKYIQSIIIKIGENIK